MKFILFFLLTSSVYAAEFIPEYTAAALVAARRGDTNLVETLITEGADPNGVAKEGHTLLTWACLRTYNFENTTGPHPKLFPISHHIEHVKFLISKGAKVNLPNAFGVAPLLIADRVGSQELTDLLKSNGAIGFDMTTLETKASVTLIDAELLKGMLIIAVINSVQHTLKEVVLYEDIKRYLDGTNVKVVLNGGKDIFGRPFKLSTLNNIEVIEANPDTLKDLERAKVRPELWKTLSDGIGK